MPNKTIYVADDDLPLYEQAQALADGNLSGAIARALRQFVEAESGRRAGFEEVVLRVGPPGSQHKKRFWGYRVTEWRHPHGPDGGVEVFSVYRTKGGRYVVYRVEMPNWLPGPMHRLLDDPRWGQFAAKAWRGAPWEQWLPSGEATFTVFDDLEQMANADLPPELIDRLRDHPYEQPVEDLDI